MQLLHMGVHDKVAAMKFPRFTVSSIALALFACGGRTPGSDSVPPAMTTSTSSASSQGSGTGTGTSTSGTEAVQPTPPPVGFGSSTRSPTSALYGSWDLGGENTVLILNSDGTFELQIFWSDTATGTLDVEEQTGTYTVSGTLLTLTPKQFSCSTSAPTSAYNFDIANGGYLVLTSSISGAVTVWVPQTSPGVDAASSTTGCFASNGTFTPQPLGPVAP